MEIIWPYLLIALHLVVWFGVLGPKLRRNLALLPRLATRVPRRASWPRLTVIVPARDEERAVGASLRSLLEQRYPGLHVVLANDGSSDRTGEIARALQAEFPGRLTVLDVPEPPEGWLGKPHAQWHAVRHAPEGTEIYLFADADVIHEPGTLRRAVSHLLAEDAGLLAVFPRVDCEGLLENATMPLLVHLGVALNDVRRLNDPASRTAGGVGAFTMIRRELYERFGGHEAIRSEVVDDVALALMAKRAGGRLLLVRDPAAVHLRMYHGGAEILRGFEKNVHVGIGGGPMRMIAAALVWTGLHCLPLAAMAIAFVLPGGEAKLLLFVSACLVLVTGDLVAERTRGLVRANALLTILFYPLGVLLMALVFLKAAVHSHRRTVRWRGRTSRLARQRVRMVGG